MKSFRGRTQCEAVRAGPGPPAGPRGGAGLQTETGVCLSATSFRRRCRGSSDRGGRVRSSGLQGGPHGPPRSRAAGPSRRPAAAGRPGGSRSSQRAVVTLARPRFPRRDVTAVTVIGDAATRCHQNTPERVGRRRHRAHGRTSMVWARTVRIVQPMRRRVQNVEENRPHHDETDAGRAGAGRVPSAAGRPARPPQEALCSRRCR